MICAHVQHVCGRKADLSGRACHHQRLSRSPGREKHMRKTRGSGCVLRHFAVNKLDVNVRGSHQEGCDQAHVERQRGLS